MHQLSFEYFQNDLLDFLLGLGPMFGPRLPFHHLLRRLLLGLQLHHELPVGDALLVDVLVVEDMGQFFLGVLLGRNQLPHGGLLGQQTIVFVLEHLPTEVVLHLAHVNELEALLLALAADDPARQVALELDVDAFLAAGADEEILGFYRWRMKYLSSTRARTGFPPGGRSTAPGPRGRAL